jgi:hypothetical protein
MRNGFDNQFYGQNSQILVLLGDQCGFARPEKSAGLLKI